MYISKTICGNASVKLLVILISMLSFSAVTGFAQAPNLVFTPVISSGFSQPLDIVSSGDGTNRLFIVERTGKVRIVVGGVIQPVNFIDVHDSFPTGNENGLLSMVFHPNYENNGYFFIYYLNNNYDVRITRFKAASPLSNNAVNQTTGVVIMTIPTVTSSFHNGGKMNFGPDGNLYFAVGDGSPGGDPDGHAQNGNLLWGKMIRINVDNFTTPPYYTIPADNPYVSNPAVRDEIFAIGLRNPWRWSFDRLNHDVWIADVGEAAWEEINYRTFANSGGINYGWRCYEGTYDYVTAGCLPQTSYVFPIFDYPHNNATGGFSVTGGYVYRGNEYAALKGYYICSDYISGNAWLIKPNGSGGWITSIQTGLPTSIVGFGEDENAVLYAVSLTGTLYKVTTNSGGPLAVTLLQFTAKAFTGYNELHWKTINEQDLSYYEIEYSFDAANYISAGKINAVNIPTENNYDFQHFITGFTKLFYRIKVIDKTGRSTYSDIVTLDKKEIISVKIYPTPVTGKQLNIFSKKAIEQVAIYSTEGKKVFETRLNNISGTINIPLPSLQNGLYIIRLKLEDEYVTRKILVKQKE